jgi:hypothetical protein
MPTSFVDQAEKQGAMASIGIDARRRTEQGEMFAAVRAKSEGSDPKLLPFHLAKVAHLVLVPRNGGTLLAVHRGVKFLARSELGRPGVPLFVVATDAARTIAANEETASVVRLDRFVPALGFDHNPNVLFRAAART